MFNKEVSRPSLQSVFDQQNYITNIRNDSDTARTLAQQIKTKVDKFKSVLNRNIQILSRETLFSLPGCCSLPPHQLKHDTNFGIGVAIKPSLSCSKVTSMEKESVQYLENRNNVSSVMEDNLASSGGLLWQFYISPEGEETLVHPAFTTAGSLCNKD